MFFNKLKEPVFLKAESDVTKKISELKNLLPRLPEDLRKKAEQDIKFSEIGEFGENNVAFELRNSGIPMYVIRDLHLSIDGLSAQIDFLVITRKINFVIECKNLIGDIFIDKNGNFIRKYKINGRTIEEGFYSPVTQSQRHLEIIKKIRMQDKKNFLTRRFFENNFDEVYQSIIVLANPKTILTNKAIDKNITKKVIRADQLARYIKEKNKESKLVESNDEQMSEIAFIFKNLDCPTKTDYLLKYKNNIENSIEEDEIIDHSINKDELIGKLKNYRLEKSRQEKVKPYFLFNDKQMEDLIEKMPKTKDELKNVSGFGDVKVEKYGEDILKLLL